MNIRGSSELARMQLLQRQTVEVRNALDVAGQEAVTNLKQDKYAATGGNLARLFSIERMLDRNKVFQETISMTTMRVDMVQEGLGRTLAWAESVSLDLITSTGLGDYTTSMLHARTAENAFRDTISMLNTQVAGQSLFAGVATDGPAMAGGEAILAQLDALVAGAPDVATARGLIDDYFNGVGAPTFAADAYLGSTQDLAPAEIGDGVRLDYAVRADAPEIVATLRSYAMAAVVARGALAGAPDEQLALLREAGGAILNAKEDMLTLRSRVGVSQEAVETARAQRVSEYDTYDLARANIVGADPLLAASRFQTFQAQLESVFTVTARLANLRFANFMR
jgi:flagellar hook-associated protein 3 FlgL